METTIVCRGYMFGSIEALKLGMSAIAGCRGGLRAKTI